tara:strand:- start:6895 stop:7188 length:294 start_codon:yes stop_codon:yes gene_type:complete
MKDFKGFITYYKEFLGDDKYWIDDFLNNTVLQSFLKRHYLNPSVLDFKYRIQQDLGIEKKADFLMAEFIRSDMFNHAVYLDDINKELFIYKLTRRLK